MLLLWKGGAGKPIGADGLLSSGDATRLSYVFGNDPSGSVDCRFASRPIKASIVSSAGRPRFRVVNVRVSFLSRSFTPWSLNIRVKAVDSVMPGNLRGA
jgi:hypothetical protein